MNGVPVMKLEFQQMQQTLMVALQEQLGSMDLSIQEAVKAYCTEGNLEMLLREEAKRSLDAALKEEVRSFFGYNGLGRKVVREAVLARMTELYGDADEHQP